MNPGHMIFKRAQHLAEGTNYVGNMQLVNNLGFDPSKPTYGPDSGEPTRRGIDQGLNVLGNATGIPGLGWVLPENWDAESGT